MPKKPNVPQEPPTGQYANFLVIQYNLHEVVLDFGRVAPGRSTAAMHTRVVTSPQLLLQFFGQFKDTLADIGRQAKKANEESGGGEESSPRGGRS